MIWLLLLCLQTVECEPLRVTPCIECNWSSQLNSTIEGLLSWQYKVKEAIVITMPGKSDIFIDIRNQVPHIKIIPGLKTMTLLDRFDSIEGWGKIAQEVQGDVFYLDNEVALRKVVMGEETINPDTLRIALAQLPVATYLWHPSSYWFINGAAGVQNLMEVCAIAEEVLSVKFIDQEFCGRDILKRNIQASLEVIADQPTITKMYFYNRRAWWLYDEFDLALSRVKNYRGCTTEVIIYPGAADWIEASKVLSNKLNPPCSLIGSMYE